MIQFRHPTRGLLAALAILTLGACASGPEAPAQPRQKDAGEYVTGSNVPRRSASSVKTTSAEAPQKAASAATATSN